MESCELEVVAVRVCAAFCRLLQLEGVWVRSVDYMSPEQIRSGEITPAADVYGLGCPMYECLCGAPPFAGRPGLRVL